MLIFQGISVYQYIHSCSLHFWWNFVGNLWKFSRVYYSSSFAYPIIKHHLCSSLCHWSHRPLHRINWSHQFQQSHKLQSKRMNPWDDCIFTDPWILFIFIWKIHGSVNIFQSCHKTPICNKVVISPKWRLKVSQSWTKQTQLVEVQLGFLGPVGFSQISACQIGSPKVQIHPNLGGKIVTAQPNSYKTLLKLWENGLPNKLVNWISPIPLQWTSPIRHFNISNWSSSVKNPVFDILWYWFLMEVLCSRSL